MAVGSVGSKVVELAGQPVEVRGISVGMRDTLERRVLAGGATFRAALVCAACYVPDTDDLVFTEDDEAAIAALPAQVIEPAVDAAVTLSGMSERDVEDLEGN